MLFLSLYDFLSYVEHRYIDKCLSAFFLYSEYILDPNDFPNMDKNFFKNNFCFMFHIRKNFIQVWKTGGGVNYGKI